MRMAFELFLAAIFFILVHGFLPFFLYKTLVQFYCTCENGSQPRLIVYITKVFKFFNKTGQVRRVQIQRFIYGLAIGLIILDIYIFKIVWDESLLICIKNVCTNTHVFAVAAFLMFCLGVLFFSAYTLHLERLAETGQLSEKNADILARIKDPETLTWRNIKKEMTEYLVDIFRKRSK